MGQLSRNRNYDLILKHFACMWILTVVGVLIALVLPFWLVVTLAIIGVGLIVLIFLMQLGHIILYYAIPFLLGMLHFLLLVLFIDWFGKALVLSVFIGTVIIFLLLTILGLKLIAEITDSFIYLFAVIIVFVVFSFIYIFIPISSVVLLVIAGLVVLLLAIYTVYDLNNMRNNFVRDSEVIAIALGLYLNFIALALNASQMTKKIKR
ncbi:Bax inhibitor-1 family protein [Lysinibacillus antri]|uniref:BAX inhibitor (BI)-1/YccA family protein n=1 Tax=Lysinibacillus antri TaxID=2498145 RepID=A0A3S0R7L9_9BACI|nr:Bax inhibitor-1 family protein [Lysinibacillus antri]RUL55140.1 hypothetical protein EK386_05275 [Lysinibacillus antri]